MGKAQGVRKRVVRCSADFPSGLGDPHPAWGDPRLAWGDPRLAWSAAGSMWRIRPPPKPWSAPRPQPPRPHRLRRYAAHIHPSSPGAFSGQCPKTMSPDPFDLPMVAILAASRSGLPGWSVSGTLIRVDRPLRWSRRRLESYTDSSELRACRQSSRGWHAVVYSSAL